MLAIRFAVSIIAVVVMTLRAGGLFGQDYPNRPVRIVTSEPGGGTDFASRLIAQGLAGSLKQPVIVENRGGVIPAVTVSKATPDGYTLLFEGASFWTGPLLEKVPYDPVSDFSPIALVVAQPYVLVLHPSLAANSVKELIVLAKTKPGTLNYGSGAAGTLSHLGAELFKAMAGVNIVRVPYKGTGPALNALLGGEVQLMFANAGVAAANIKSGKLRALAVTTVQPSALAPGLPTIATTLPGYEAVSMTGIFAPAKTLAIIVKRLNQEVLRVIKGPEVKDKFFSVGVETVGTSPEEATAYIKADMARVGKVIKDAGITVN